MIDEQSLNIIEQVTLHKLEYARGMLKSVNQASSGPRSKVREQLISAIESDLIPVQSLQLLLDELDTWGDQRLRLGRISAAALNQFRSAASIRRKANEAGLAAIFDGELALNPPSDLTPMRISYVKNAEQQLLKLIAAKTRQIMQPQPTIPDLFNEQYPGVVFKPFKVETQKVIAFAEIDLNTGLSIFSTALLRHGNVYKAEFKEFFTVFRPLISLEDAEIVTLYQAVRQIRQLPKNVVKLVARQAKTKVGGTIDYRSHSPRSDMREDPELDRSQKATPDAPDSHCNCFWEPNGALTERTHTHIFAPLGEVSIIGQIGEDSARYVLHSILGFN